MWPFGRRAKPALGKRGERAARKFLKRKGMKILAENFRCPRGEVDLIAFDRSTRAETGETICFVEVKTRSSDRYTDPESAVDAGKRARIKRAADYYLAGRAAAEGLNVRFDVVSIVMATDGQPQVKHIADAF